MFYPLSVLNKSVKRMVFEPDCTMIVADRGTGKSTLLALIFEAYRKAGFKCLCNYPYKDCYKIPFTRVVRGKTTKLVVDKDWLYSYDFKDCVIAIDEAKTVWPARNWQNWDESDSEFFNFIRKNNIRLFIVTQSYDEIDLNVRRACDENWFLIKERHFNLTTIERSKQTQAKVGDKTKELQGKLYKKGAQKINWEIVEIPLGTYKFYRKPYYGDFVTNLTMTNKPAPPDLISWNNSPAFQIQQQE